MKKVLLILISILPLLPATGQERALSFTGGIATYNLVDLEQYQEVLLNRLPVEARQLSLFPPYSNFALRFFVQGDKGFRYGAILQYATTGAHANYTDYSGYLNLDQSLVSINVGLTAGYRFLSVPLSDLKLDFSGYGDLCLGIVRDKVEMSLNTRFYYDASSINLSSSSPSTQLGMEAMLRFSALSIGIDGGYLLDFGSTLNSGSYVNPGNSVSLYPTQDLRSDISGFRVGLKLTVWLNQYLEKE